MLTIDQLQLGSTVKFDLYNSQVLGNGYANVQAVAVLDQETANYFIDTVAMHANVFPQLPAGTPDDPSAYKYLKIKISKDKSTVVGIPWIKDDTYAVLSNRKIQITFTGDQAAQQRMVEALSANGFTGFDVKYLD